MINLLDNGIFQVNRECQISDSLLFSKSKNLNNFSINIITPPSKISLKTIVPYLNQISIENALTVTLSLTILIITIIAIKLYQYYLIIKNRKPIKYTLTFRLIERRNYRKFLKKQQYTNCNLYTQFKQPTRRIVIHNNIKIRHK